jgi:hypothetical protein
LSGGITTFEKIFSLNFTQEISKTDLVISEKATNF